MSDWIGYQWLAQTYQVTPVQAFRVNSRIALKRATVAENNYRHEFYLAKARPADTLAAHLTFAFKHEGVHLEFLARLFQVLPKAELEAWISSEPTGQYARRAGFFYEWLSGQTLACESIKTGTYITALDPDRYFTAMHIHKNSRWRVYNNLPGTREFCPLILRTATIRAAEEYDCNQQLENLEAEYGTDLLMRSSVWLTIKESRASFAIEHEEGQIDRVKRFAMVMERRCGMYEAPLSQATLSELQKEILGEQATRYGMRRSPVFVGEVRAWAPVVHYIAPHWQDVPEMIEGLKVCEQRTRELSPIIRAAILSFGFLYIHPMSDGNGRISRFLVNDILRRDQAIIAPFILPISACIASTSRSRRGYDEVLELFSRRFMQRYQNQYRFGPEKIAEDGIHYNLEFDAYQDANFAWRYIDLTDHVEYLAQVIAMTIDEEMRSEASYLRELRQSRQNVKEILEGPDVDIDRIIRSIQENQGQISNKLKQAFPLLNDPALADKVIAAVNTAFSKPKT